jgi:hypothetical protein
MIDISTGPDFLELVKLAVTAAVEALPPNTLVGIITLSDCVRCPLDAETIKACKYQVALATFPGSGVPLFCRDDAFQINLQTMFQSLWLG